MDSITLDKLTLFKEGIIKKILGNFEYKNRLLELGFVENTKIKPVLMNSAKDFVAYEIKKTIIALRNIDAEKILVEVDY